MIKDALRSEIEALRGYRVTHAVFTTYAFEPEFFETSILPQLLPDGERNLSLHSMVRRLQLESILRVSPISIDVYFDARVVMPGCPLLPYEMKAMRPQGEFHGKVILLRLEDQAGGVRCILGSGSANLTQAGWWENIEAWHFAKAFDPSRPPAGILPGITALLDFLAESGQPGEATTTLRSSLAQAVAAGARSDEPVFGVFLPARVTFLEWLKDRVKTGDDGAPLEIISPYFAESGHAQLTDALLDATGCNRLDLWLPIDPWQAGGPAALIEESSYDELSAFGSLRWCEMKEANLAASRKQDETPRFLHAKIIRRPGAFCFMGSVNFTSRAVRVNFEAGFLFPDQGDAWLQPTAVKPALFQKASEPARHEGVEETLPELRAGFDWKTSALSVQFARRTDGTGFENGAFRLIDAQGRESRNSLKLPAEVFIKADEALYRDLQTNPWIGLLFPDGRKALVWVQQTGLEYRPPHDDLRPDVWRILEMWRALAGGKPGSQPDAFEHLEIILRQRLKDHEVAPEGEPERDIFEAMATAHGSFYLLRRRLQEEREGGNVQRCEYYFSAPRPDTLASLVDRIERPKEGESLEAVAAWVILHWITQICRDHEMLPAARTLFRRAQEHLETLLATAPLNTIEPEFLEWAREMFLCEPGSERNVMCQIKEVETQ
ncbi:hypothetical protein CA602_15325 [Paraburkholderia hospita]|nr:hypothetical protein CA602_15325 [Paraburkholderia hospita]